MGAASKFVPLWKLHSRDRPVCQACSVKREAVVFWEETSKGTRRTLRGTAPGAYARIAEIMSGATDSQQGLVATCKDPLYTGRPKAAGGIRWGA